jgi:hypothetical protein
MAEHDSTRTERPRLRGRSHAASGHLTGPRDVICVAEGGKLAYAAAGVGHECGWIN